MTGWRIAIALLTRGLPDEDQKPTATTCAACGNEFVKQVHNSVTCGDECRRIRNNLLRNKRRKRRGKL